MTKTPQVYFMCFQCEEENPEGCVHVREDLRVLPDGKLICDTCWIDTPPWTYHTKPADEDAEPLDWNDLPGMPQYAPLETLVDAVSRCASLDENGYICEKGEAIKAMRNAVA